MTKMAMLDRQTAKTLISLHGYNLILTVCLEVIQKAPKYFLWRLHCAITFVINFLPASILCH